VFSGGLREVIDGSPHVRAIASRPVPSRPVPTLPVPSRPLIQEEEEPFWNPNISPYKPPSRASDFCWACDEGRWHHRGSEPCEWCSAPWWNGAVCASYNGPGVYVVGSSVGLCKIGMSGVHVSGRARGVISEARKRGYDGEILCVLPGATSSRIERWLHQVFWETRDKSWANTVEDLPFHTEWFWPTPALHALVAGEAFAERIAPELAA
jgi:hypothetical protein